MREPAVVLTFDVRTQPMDARLDATHQKKDQQDEQNEAQTAAGVIAPSTAIRPRRQCANDEHEHDDQKNKRHGVPLRGTVVPVVNLMTQSAMRLRRWDTAPRRLGVGR